MAASLAGVNPQSEVPLRPGPHHRRIRPHRPVLVRSTINPRRRPPSPTYCATSTSRMHAIYHAWLAGLQKPISIFSSAGLSTMAWGGWADSAARGRTVSKHMRMGRDVGWVTGWADLAIPGTGYVIPVSCTRPASNLQDRPTSMLHVLPDAK